MTDLRKRGRFAKESGGGNFSKLRNVPVDVDVVRWMKEENG
jgi:hypothetical protein